MATKSDKSQNSVTKTWKYRQKTNISKKVKLAIKNAVITTLHQDVFMYSRVEEESFNAHYAFFFFALN